MSIYIRFVVMMGLFLNSLSGCERTNPELTTSVISSAFKQESVQLSDEYIGMPENCFIALKDRGDGMGLRKAYLCIDGVAMHDYVSQFLLPNNSGCHHK